MNKKNDEKLIENWNFSFQEMRKEIDFVIELLTKVFKKHSSKKLYQISIKIKEIIKRKNDEEIYSYIKKISKSLTDIEFLYMCRYFAYHELLTNLVEDIYQTSYENKWEDSYLNEKNYLVKFFKGLKKTNKNLNKLKNIDISIVLTAHPTQVVRETILKITRKIMEYLDIQTSYNSLFNIHLLDKKENLEVLIDILWQVAILRDKKISVFDEIKSILSYFDTTFFSIIPKINYKFNQLLLKNYQLSLQDNVPIKIGSWIGGDRDGNPFVDANSLEIVFKLQVEKLFSFYFSKIANLYYDLLIHVSVSEIDKKIIKFSKKINIENREKEPYAKAILKINTKLFNTLKFLIKDNRVNNFLNLVELDERYKDSSEFLNDLNLILNSLKNNNSYQIAKRNLVDLIYSVKTFEFYLMSVDIRQNSIQHKLLVNELLKENYICENYINLDLKNKKELLIDFLENKRDSNNFIFSESSKKEILIFQKILEIQNKFSNNAIKNYLISNTEDFVNILEVMFLFKIANKKNTEINIVPLFESINDLSNSNKIIEEFITNEFTGKFIKNILKNKIEVLLGYSDSCKDGGNFASSWKIYNVQKELTYLSKKYKIEISFFHGRGGTIGRGGGPSYYAINSQPKGSIIRKLRFTEQGEIIWAKYSNPRKGWFNLETILTAAANAIVNQKKNLLENEEFFKAMNFLSNLSCDKYHSLINRKKFEKVFFDITPIKEISKLKIGSRPSSRNSKNNLKNLRSIPWVFSWSQVRAMIPGWYGVGSALDFYIKQNDKNLEKLKSWYKNAPFFQSLLSNIEMLLAKVNLNITKRYFETSKEKESINIFNEINNEYNKILKSILLITEKEYLLQDYRDLKISLDDRIPYLNILNYFQLELISRKRKNKKSKLNDESILISINGIATGLRNSG